MKNYDDWKLDTPDSHLKVFCNCAECGNPIHIGEEYIHTESGNFCNYDSICFEMFCKQYFGVSILTASK